MNKKLSFDFDGTLSREDVQSFVRELIKLENEVWIVTSRTDGEQALARGWHWIKGQNEDLFEVAEMCGIPNDRIVFTDHVDKIGYLEGKNFLFHLDDDEFELMSILESSESCKPVNVNHFEWKETCIDILKKQ
jgi:hypothetical protein